MAIANRSDQQAIIFWLSDRWFNLINGVNATDNYSDGSTSSTNFTTNPDQLKNIKEYQQEEKKHSRQHSK
jgi:hypothetical protein